MTQLGEPDDAARMQASVELAQALRAWAGAFGEYGRRFGVAAGMHVTDADALIHIINAEDDGSPLMQSELSRRIGLSVGATSSLINRLENAGHIERHRDSADRRVVTLRSTAAVHERVNAFFSEVTVDIDQALAQHPSAAIDSSTALIRDMTAVMRKHLHQTTTRPEREGAN